MTGESKIVNKGVKNPFLMSGCKVADGYGIMLEAAHLKEKLEKCEAEMESSMKASELNLLPLSSFTTEARHDLFHAEDTAEESNMVVPHIPTSVSRTALAASLNRDGWSLAKMFAKYQEAVDAVRHEQLGRKQSQAILERLKPKSPVTVKQENFNSK